MAEEGAKRKLAAILMAKAKKYRLAICLTTFCLCLLSVLTITKNAFPSDKTEIQTLINRLKSKGRFDREKAAEELGSLRGANAKDAVPALIEALKDNDKSVRWAAAEALGNFGPGGAQLLIEALKSKYEDVRQAAV